MGQTYYFQMEAYRKFNLVIKFIVDINLTLYRIGGDIGMLHYLQLTNT